MIGENPIIVVDLKEKSMDIRIGFVDSGRELAITGVERGLRRVRQSAKRGRRAY